MSDHKKYRYPIILMGSFKSVYNKCVHWFALENTSLEMF